MPHSNPEQRKAYARAYHAANKDRPEYRQSRIESSKRHYGRYKYQPLRCQKNGALKSRHGIDLETFEFLLERQAGLCAVCCLAMSPGRDTCIDHDHRCCPDERSCGKCIRGLIHRTCNTMLGHSKDDALTLCGGADYIRYTNNVVPGTLTE